MRGKYRFIRVKPETHIALGQIKYLLELPSFDQTIKHLIRYYKERELSK